MEKINNIIGREVLDSRGNPTVEVEMTSDQGKKAWAIVPSGASTGIHEALELRDGDKKRYHGKGVLKAVENINTVLRKELFDFPLNQQAMLDMQMIEMDGTENKSKFGANAILGVSMAYSRLSAMSQGKKLFEHLGDGRQLPIPMMNVLNGGAHADNGLFIQEFMIMPLGAADSIHESVRIGSEIFHTLQKILQKDGYHTGVGDEGGFAPNLKSNFQALEYLEKAVKESGYKLKKDIMFALDVAISQFYKGKNKYVLPDGGKELKMSTSDVIEYMNEIIERFPMFSIEDPLFEDDFEGWVECNNKIGDKVQLVGDDFLVTNPKRLREAIDMNAANSILIKLNQIGTVTETINTIKMAQNCGWQCVISHRSGETEDTFIADLAVGINAGQIKTGSLSRTDRVAKYNQLMRIEEYLKQ